MIRKYIEKVIDENREKRREIRDLRLWSKFTSSVKEGDYLYYMGNRYKVTTRCDRIFSSTIKLKYHDHRHTVRLYEDEINKHINYKHSLKEKENNND